MTFVDRQFLFLAVLYIAVSFYFLDKYPPVYADETLYSQPCINFLRGKGFNTEIYQPGFGFNETNLIQARIFYFFQVLSFYFGGINVISMRIQPFLAGLGVLLLTTLITKELFSNNRIAILTSFALAASHTFTFTSHMSRPDITVSLFIVSVVYLFLQAEKRNKLSLYFLSGLVSTLAVDVHPSGNIALFVLFSLWIQQIFSRGINSKTLLSIGGGVSLGILWWLFWHVLLNPKLFFEQYQAYKDWADLFGRSLSLNPLSLNPYKDELRRWHSFFWLGAYHRNMFLLLLFSISFFYAVSKWKQPGYKTVLSILIGGICGLTFGAPSKVSWYLIWIYPYMTLCVVTFLYDYYHAASSIKKGIAIAFSVCFFAFLFLENFSKLHFYKSSYATFVDKIKAHVPKSSSVLVTDNLCLGMLDYSNNILVTWVLLTRGVLEKRNMNIGYYSGTFDNFLKRSNIEYIVADTELLSWPELKDDLNKFIQNHCFLVTEIEDPFYNSSDFLNKVSPRPLVTKIYKIDLNAKKSWELGSRSKVNANKQSPAPAI